MTTNELSLVVAQLSEQMSVLSQGMAAILTGMQAGTFAAKPVAKPMDASQFQPVGQRGKDEPSAVASSLPMGKPPQAKDGHAPRKKSSFLADIAAKRAARVVPGTVKAEVESLDSGAVTVRNFLAARKDLQVGKVVSQRGKFYRVRKVLG